MTPTPPVPPAGGRGAFFLPAGGARGARRGAAQQALGSAAGAQRSGDRRHPTAAGPGAPGASMTARATAGTTASPFCRIRRGAAMHKTTRGCPSRAGAHRGTAHARTTVPDQQAPDDDNVAGRSGRFGVRRTHDDGERYPDRAGTSPGLHSSAARRGAITQEENMEMRIALRPVRTRRTRRTPPATRRRATSNAWWTSAPTRRCLQRSTTPTPGCGPGVWRGSIPQDSCASSRETFPTSCYQERAHRCARFSSCPEGSR